MKWFVAYQRYIPFSELDSTMYGSRRESSVIKNKIIDSHPIDWLINEQQQQPTHRIILLFWAEIDERQEDNKLIENFFETIKHMGALNTIACARNILDQFNRTTIKEPDNLDWMTSLSGVIGQNDTPWWGSDVVVTPLNEGYKNVGYAIKISGWEHFALVFKRQDKIYCIKTESHWERGECRGFIRYDNFDESPKMKYFWGKTIEILRNHVNGEENLQAYDIN